MGPKKSKGGWFSKKKREQEKEQHFHLSHNPLHPESPEMRRAQQEIDMEDDEVVRKAIEDGDLPNPDLPEGVQDEQKRTEISDWELDHNL